MARIWNLQIGHASPNGLPDAAGDYWGDDGTGGKLASLYGELLGKRRIDIGYKKLARDGDPLEIGFEYAPDNPAPRWPDPEHPQQLHLDIEVGDLDAAEGVALRWGARRLRDSGNFRVLSDAFGHPFCLYEGPRPVRIARIARIVFDCFSPRSLALFYDRLLDMPVRVLDTPERVVIARADGGAPMLAFQHAQFVAARWPDPAYPAQIHLDLGFDDVEAAQTLAEQLGAIRLRDGVYADPASHPFCLGGTDEPDPSWTDIHRQWSAAQTG